MEYKTPIYEINLVETEDILLVSSTKLEGGAQLAETNNTNAQVFTSIFDIFK